MTAAASIVIPVFNGLSFARTCLDSVYQARTAVPFEVIVVDNGSGPEVATWLEAERNRRPNLTAVRFDRPLGFARAVNEGARQAKHDLIVPLNSDTLVTDNWLDGLAAAIASDRSLGVVSPVTNSVGTGSQLDPAAAKLTPRKARSYASRILPREELLHEPERLAFFCVMVRREVWERFDGLAECYREGNYEDEDFCVRARLAGYRLAVARNAFVFHHRGSPTFALNRVDHDAAMTRNQLLFCSRSSGWARSREFTDRQRHPLPEVSVIVPVLAGQAGEVEDSLASLIHQTACGFQVVLVSASAVAQRYHAHLCITEVKSQDDSGVAALLDAGLAAANGEQIAFLPAGDIFYPCHLELLSQALRGSPADAVSCAWSVVERAGEDDPQRRAAVQFHGASPSQLGLDNQPPLPCWLFRRPSIAGEGFDRSFPHFTCTEFVLRTSRRLRAQFLPRIGFERRIGSPAERDPGRMAEARRLLKQFPAAGAPDSINRVGFLESVESGRWEAFPLLSSQRASEPDRESPSTLRRRAAGLARQVYRTAVPLKVRYGIEWRTRRLLRLPPVLRTDSGELQKAREALAEAILRSQQIPRPTGAADVLLFNIVAWDHLVQRPHHFARQLAARGHRVFWIDVRFKPAQQVDPEAPAALLEPGIWKVELPCAPGQIYFLKWSAPVLSAMEMAAAQLRTAHGIRDAIQLIHFPQWTPLAIALRARFGWPIVYDCLDDHRAFSELFRHDAASFEDELTRQCDLLIASGRLLFEDRQRMNKRATLIPNACDFDLFHSGKPAGLLNDVPRPIAGFFGAISDWLDLDWVEQAAARFPGWSFVYIGRPDFADPARRRRWKNLSAAPNIRVLPPVDPQILAAYLAEFDVCIMPFRILPVTRTMNAVKIYEYLAAGKPVVIPDIEELRPLAERELISIYRDYPQSFQLLERSVREEPNERRAARIAFARENTWEERANRLEAALAALSSGGAQRIL